MGHLRRISVFVDESEQGHFYWVLHESTEGGVWTDIESSVESYDMWLDAFDAGCVALLKLVTDERIGPRVPSEDAAPRP
ncbi:hypothetical protein QTH97_26070 [Variovorax sp. J22R24]|uniref:hypothetical protein n=1 Tax=Variovorax gracilis TaxID=3053502 RepID=UPI002575B182|nr:hypothetical protein [Variovorax sp. J22R24]MDM0108442.1 hypothetical protein [Variovorax sp. J22R24]